MTMPSVTTIHMYAKTAAEYELKLYESFTPPEGMYISSVKVTDESLNGSCQTSSVIFTNPKDMCGILVYGEEVVRKKLSQARDRSVSCIKEPTYELRLALEAIFKKHDDYTQCLKSRQIEVDFAFLSHPIECY